MWIGSLFYTVEMKLGGRGGGGGVYLFEVRHKLYIVKTGSLGHYSFLVHNHCLIFIRLSTNFNHNKMCHIYEQRPQITGQGHIPEHNLHILCYSFILYNYWLLRHWTWCDIDLRIPILTSAPISHHVQCLNSQQLFYYIISLSKKESNNNTILTMDYVLDSLEFLHDD